MIYVPEATNHFSVDSFQLSFIYIQEPLRLYHILLRSKILIVFLLSDLFQLTPRSKKLVRASHHFLMDVSSASN